MILQECLGCGRKNFNRRSVCPNCFGKEFRTKECTNATAIVSTRMTVTPDGFEDQYDLVLGMCDGASVLFRDNTS